MVHEWKEVDVGGQLLDAMHGAVDTDMLAGIVADNVALLASPLGQLQRSAADEELVKTQKLALPGAPGTITLATETVDWVLTFSKDVELNELQTVRLLAHAVELAKPGELFHDHAEKMYFSRRYNLLLALYELLCAHHDNSALKIPSLFSMLRSNGIVKNVLSDIQKGVQQQSRKYAKQRLIETKLLLKILFLLRSKEKEWSQHECQALLDTLAACVEEKIQHRGSMRATPRSYAVSMLSFCLIAFLQESQSNVPQHAALTYDRHALDGKGMLGLIATIYQQSQETRIFHDNCLLIIRDCFQLWTLGEDDHLRSSSFPSTMLHFFSLLASAYVDGRIQFSLDAEQNMDNVYEPVEILWGLFKDLVTYNPKAHHLIWSSEHLATFLKLSVDMLSMNSEELPEFVNLMKCLVHCGKEGPQRVEHFFTNTVNLRWLDIFGILHDIGDKFGSRTRRNVDMFDHRSGLSTFEGRNVASILSLIQELGQHENTRSLFLQHQFGLFPLCISLLRSRIKFDATDTDLMTTDTDPMSLSLSIQAAILNTLATYSVALEGEDRKLASLWTDVHEAMADSVHLPEESQKDRLSHVLQLLSENASQEQRTKTYEWTMSFIAVLRRMAACKKELPFVVVYIHFLYTKVLLPSNTEREMWNVLHTIFRFTLESLQRDQYASQLSSYKLAVLDDVFGSAAFGDKLGTCVVDACVSDVGILETTGDDKLAAMACLESCLALFWSILSQERRIVEQTESYFRSFPLSDYLLRSESFMLALADIFTIRPHVMITFLALAIFARVDDSKALLGLLKSQSDQFDDVCIGLSSMLGDVNEVELAPIDAQLVPILESLPGMSTLFTQELGLIPRRAIEVLLRHLSSDVPNLSLALIGFHFRNVGGLASKSRVAGLDSSNSTLDTLLALATKPWLTRRAPALAASLFDLLHRLVQMPITADLFLKFIWETNTSLFVDALVRFFETGQSENHFNEHISIVSRLLECIAAQLHYKARMDRATSPEAIPYAHSILAALGLCDEDSDRSRFEKPGELAVALLNTQDQSIAIRLLRRLEFADQVSAYQVETHKVPGFDFAAYQVAYGSTHFTWNVAELTAGIARSTRNRMLAKEMGVAALEWNKQVVLTTGYEKAISAWSQVLSLVALEYCTPHSAFVLPFVSKLVSVLNGWKGNTATHQICKVLSHFIIALQQQHLDTKTRQLSQLVDQIALILSHAPGHLSRCQLSYGLFSAVNLLRPHAASLVDAFFAEPRWMQLLPLLYADIVDGSRQDQILCLLLFDQYIAATTCKGIAFANQVLPRDWMRSLVELALLPDVLYVRAIESNEQSHAFENYLCLTKLLDTIAHTDQGPHELVESAFIPLFMNAAFPYTASSHENNSKVYYAFLNPALRICSAMLVQTTASPEVHADVARLFIEKQGKIAFAVLERRAFTQGSLEAVHCLTTALKYLLSGPLCLGDTSQRSTLMDRLEPIMKWLPNLTRDYTELAISCLRSDQHTDTGHVLSVLDALLEMDLLLVRAHQLHMQDEGYTALGHVLLSLFDGMPRELDRLAFAIESKTAVDETQRQLLNTVSVLNSAIAFIATRPFELFATSVFRAYQTLEQIHFRGQQLSKMCPHPMYSTLISSCSHVMSLLHHSARNSFERGQ